MDHAAMEILVRGRQDELRAEAERWRQVRGARGARGPSVRERTVGAVVELVSGNPAATSRLLLSQGAQVIEHDEVGDLIRTVFADRDRVRFWVVRSA